MSSISETAVIHPNVQLGNGCTVEDYVVLGAPVRGTDPFPPTIIGENCIIRSHTVIYAGNRIGDNFQTGNKTNIREFNEIGDDVSIGTLSVVEHHVKIGNGSSIHSQVFIPEYSVLKERAWLGPNVVLTNARARLAVRSAHRARRRPIHPRTLLVIRAFRLHPIVTDHPMHV